MYTNEKSHMQKFWIELIHDVFGIDNPLPYIEFEKRVESDTIRYIDAYIPSTGTIIEQKSQGKNLDAAFCQAKNYHDWLPLSQRGRYIITCDFKEIHVHDMEHPANPPEIILVSAATKANLDFLIVPGKTLPREEAISIEAGTLVGKLYDHLRNSLDKLYPEENSRQSQAYKDALNDINVFCVRLVFLLYAEDSGLFRKSQFHDYLKPRKIMAREALAQLFTVLKTEVPLRDPFFDPALKDFPYVNGGLFDKDVKFPKIDDEALNIILEVMAEKFDWSGISPAIFGAIFEATLNEETRHQEGMHYTSLENIHKLIDPLFLDGLNETFNGIISEPPSWERERKLLAFQEKLASLKFLDPACGSGNFLTESFLSLRRLENRILAALPQNNRPEVKVSITQFHGIEVHDFAVNVARTALWISDHQMWKETQNITPTKQPPLPLKDYHHIKEGSAMAELPYEGWGMPGWKILHDDMLYIMGNPPFLGYSQQNDGQKKDVKHFFGKAKSDYVSCWFGLASEYLKDKNTKAAFVATNSITQGEQVAYVFKTLHERWEIKIDFAHQPFVWKNKLPDPKKMAHVHVVIIGFSTNPPELRRLYTADGMKLVRNINFYLTEGADDDIAETRGTPISRNAPAMMAGNRPADGGQLLIKGKDYADFIKREPRAAKYIKRFMMGDEFINNIPRYCLWLVGATPQEIHDMPLVRERVEACRAERLKGAPDRQKLADTPYLFREQMNPSRYIAIPKTSSEKRYYIPMAWLDNSVIPGDGLHIIPDATLYDFGVQTSRVHMAWTRRVCGRLKSDYSYSNTVVYNTFAWPTPSPKQRAEIEKTAQGILDARALYPDSSFAALYDDTLMPKELRCAHERNDRAVCRAYGWDGDISEEDIVSRLFGLYHSLMGK